MTIEMIVALIGASVVAYAIANRFRLIAPVLLIAAGVGAAFLPFGEEMHLPRTGNICSILGVAGDPLRYL